MMPTKTWYFDQTSVEVICVLQHQKSIAATCDIHNRDVIIIVLIQHFGGFWSSLICHTKRNNNLRYIKMYYAPVRERVSYKKYYCKPVQNFS